MSDIYLKTNRRSIYHHMLCIITFTAIENENDEIGVEGWKAQYISTVAILYRTHTHTHKWTRIYSFYYHHVRVFYTLDEFMRL